MIVLTVLLLFTTVLPNKADKEADASISMTLAGIAATVGGSAMLPYALGAAGILAVGGVIKNWDVVKDYGEKVIARMGGYDAASGSYVQNPDGTATVIYSPAIKLAMAQAVDSVPSSITVSNPTGGIVWQPVTFSGIYYDPDIAVPAGSVVAFKFDYSIVDNNPNGDYTGLYISTNWTGGIAPNGPVIANPGLSGTYQAILTTPVSGNTTVTKVIRVRNTAVNITETITNAQYAVYNPQNTVTNTQVDTTDTFGTVADNVNARLLGMNAAIADGQAVTISADAELLNASIDDLASISNATLTETQTQTGILSQIWKAILGSITAINNVSTNITNSVNAKMDDLWEDAGAIWSGLADTATGIRADITAKMGALQDAMSGGIDNVRSGINDMIAGLNAGIDTVSNNMAAWGQLTLDGIDAGVGAITTGLTNTWTNINTAVTDGVGAITGSITNAMDDINTWITDFPTTMLRVFVPPNFDFMQPLLTATTSTLQLKFGPLETLPNVFKNIFGSSKSIYDIEITVMDHTYKIVPIFLKPVIDGARPFLTGAINLMSLTILYRRYKGNLVIPA